MEDIKVYCENTQAYESVTMGTTLQELCQKLGCADILAALVDNKLKSLDYKVITPHNVCFIGYEHPDGRRAYIRSLCFVLQKVVRELPTMMNVNTHVENDSMFNTPPVFPIYVLRETLKWMKNEGGLEEIYRRNVEKAELLYAEIDRNSLFRGTVEKEDRSLMNVPFVTGDADLDAKFVKEAAAAGFVNIKGHRSVGGMRASIYNAMPIEGVEALVAFMKKFAEENPKS